MSKLSISIDMGAKNNGVFIVKTNNDKIISKKATNIIVEKGSINFSKKSRRENRHKDRNYKRRKQSKRLLWEILESKKYNNAQVEHINGLLNNRGYTFLSVENEFEVLQDRTIEFIDNYFEDLKGLKSKENFEKKFDNFINDEELINFIDNTVNNITQLIEQLKIFEKIEDIRKDFKSIKEKNYNKKFKQSSYLTKIFDKYEIYYSFENEDKTITKIKLSKIKSEELVPTITKYNIDLSKIDFNKEEQILKDINELFNSFKIDIDNKYTQDVQKPNQKDIKDNFKKILELIKNDLTSHKEKPNLIDFLLNIKKEIQTGSKPRKQYLKEIKEEIAKLDFIDNKDKFYNLIGNISNLQLRVLRKFFNLHSSHKARFDILKKYFISHHYKSDDEKQRRKNIFKILNQHNNLEEFLYSCDPLLTIPPYEDMNNRDTYKCNSMLIKPELITDDIKEAIDAILKNEYFKKLLNSSDEKLKIEKLYKTRTATNDKYIKKDFTYSKYLQRILDAVPEVTTKELNPRNVFKHMKTFNNSKVFSVKEFKKTFGDKVYFTLEPIASKYYNQEEQILNGIYDEKISIFEICQTNTPYKNNIKHTLLKPLYSYNFTVQQSDNFIEAIKNTRGVKAQLELISTEAKKYQNRFYSVVLSCFENNSCVDDKELKKLIKNLPNTLKSIKTILKELNIQGSYLDEVEKLNSDNISRVLNIFKQTYEILFKELGGFSKTCKHCTVENSIRSDEQNTIAKRLLSDVAKPIDGMLDFMLDRVSFEIVSNISKDDIKDIDNLEILLEQNKFEFELNLNEIKRANNNSIKKLKNDYKDSLNINICPYTGESFDKGDFDHILPQSKGVYNSTMNMIYCSTVGNRQKGAKDYKLNNLHQNHLKAIFKTLDLDEIISKISQGLTTIDIDKFKNFDNLKLTQQIALRYALFMEHSSKEFQKAYKILQLDKIKTFSNGTQKRLARLIYNKIVQKYPNEFQDIKISSKVVDNKLVSSTRKYLAVDSVTGEINHLFKEDIQNSHSHCIDAIVVFYLANSKIKNQNSYKNTIIEPIFSFDDIYLSETKINNLSKRQKFINAKDISSYKLFDDTIYSEHYKHIQKDDKNIDILIEFNLVYQNIKGKKSFIKSLDNIDENKHILIDVDTTSNLLNKLFKTKDKTSLEKLKFLDNLRYSTSRKEIIDIFFDDRKTKLLGFDKIKSIPPYSFNLYKAVYTKLKTEEKLFKEDDKDKFSLDENILNQLLKDMFESKQQDRYKQQRKRAKKRHKYTLPISGSPKFRINRNETWQVLGNKDIATKNYIINGNIKPIPFFSKNTIPLKIADLIDCLLLDDTTISVYELDIDTQEIKEYISKLKYLVTESKRTTVEVTLYKNSFKTINFDTIKLYDGTKDDEFKKFLEEYIENKEIILSKYIGSIRDGLKGKMIVLDNNSDTITLQYKAGINQEKKKIILDNL